MIKIERNGFCELQTNPLILTFGWWYKQGFPEGNLANVSIDKLEVWSAIANWRSGDG